MNSCFLVLPRVFFQFWQAWEWFRNLSERSGSTKKQEFIEIWNFDFSIFWWEIWDIWHFRDLSTIMVHHGWSWGSYGEDIHGMGWWYAISDFRLFFTYFEVRTTPVRSPETTKRKSCRLSKILKSRKKSVISCKNNTKASDLQILTHLWRLHVGTCV